MQDAWNQLNAGRVKSMATWRDSTISTACPVGKTLLYPFSGPDFFNAYWLFPDCETFVMFGLEHIGELPNIEGMNERQIARLMTDVRNATGDLFDRNYFITGNMSKQLRTAQLRGVVPLLAIQMSISGMDILRIVPFDLSNAPAAAIENVNFNAPAPPESTERGRPLRQLKGVSIEFRAGSSGKTKRLIYFSVDATDNGLAKYPQFLTFLRTLGPTTTLLKSASYLLHSRNFQNLRKTVLDVSAFLLQDDSGMPYGTLIAAGWDVRLHGNYHVPIPPFERAYQPALANAYKTQQSAPLPFTFGYNFRDQRDERSNLIVGIKSQRQQTAEAVSERPAAMRSKPKSRQRGGA